MKIGIDARPLISSQPSGIGTYLVHVLRYISAMDDKNEYILYSNKEMEYPIDLGENFQKKVIPGKVGTLWLRYILPRYIAKDALDVFWGTQHFLPLPVKRVKMYLTIHDTALLIKPRWGSRVNAIMQNVYLKSSARQAHCVIAVSASTKQDIIRLCGVHTEQIRVVYEGAPAATSHSVLTEEQKCALREKLKIADRYYLYVGNIEPRKNIETIVSAFNIVASGDLSVRLVLGGRLGWRYEELLRLVEKSPYRDRILMTGYLSQEEKCLLYEETIAFLFPSHYEGFGLPVLEAYRYGAPVITAKKSSLPEVGGDAAWYVEDENNVQALASLMEAVQNVSLEERKRRVDLGYVQCEKFSWETCAKETMEILLKGD